jgi:hypothetical protein
MSAKLSLAFSKTLNELELSGYLKEISLRIATKTFDRDALKEILKSYKINESIAKVDLLHLILEYIKIAFQDDILLSSS